MEGHISSTESANSPPLSTYDLLILHTAEAQEWATYLQQILKSSRKFRKESILLYTVSPADQLHGYSFEYFHKCKCIVLLLTGAFLDILYDSELQGALQRLLYPSDKVVALLCNVSEDDILTDCFEDWPSWRKLYAEDEPVVYVSTILESIANSERGKTEHASQSAAAEKSRITTASSSEDLITDESEEVASHVENNIMPGDDELVSSVTAEHGAPPHFTCLTVQPKRLLCGEEESIFIIFTHKVDYQLTPEVEFSAEDVPPKRVRGTMENEYTLRVTAPDMPAGEVSLTMYTDLSSVSLKTVTYYTNMEEVSRCLNNATDPIDFICQAFNLTSNSTESLDNMLTNCLKSRLPATGLELFGIKQIEEENMATYQRNVELPTLLHFAAKYGLKKLTTILLQSPGAVQAYSVMNKNGDFPNTLAERSGFSDLRHFMDEFIETTAMLKSHMEDSINTDEHADVYELMLASSQDIMKKYSGSPEDIYESMRVINPECAEEIYEVMNAVEDNPEEAMLRTFFQAQPPNTVIQDNKGQLENEPEEQEELDEIYLEEDPYNLGSEDIYDTVDTSSFCNPAILYRPPAPIPRPDFEPEREKPVTYISRVFTDPVTPQSKTVEAKYSAARPVSEHLAPVCDPYAMKTPGQRQLISLQERVKVGEINVDEAVQEFKAWQIDHERRANSIRYQQENLKRLRESIIRHQKQKEKAGKDLDLQISAPLQTNLYWGSRISSSEQSECALYESSPRVVALPPSAAQPIQRGGWKTSSTSSTSSNESNRLSTHSTVSYSSGTEPDFEDSSEVLPPLPPPRPSDCAPLIPPPRIPPRIPARLSESMLHERYISNPNQRPRGRHESSAPAVPRRAR
ncbi:phosphoinositide 3-kinase adapter protein 1 [Aulostomus maculatus]